jgi:hypothetical protein
MMIYLRRSDFDPQGIAPFIMPYVCSCHGKEWRRLVAKSAFEPAQPAYDEWGAEF